MAVYLYNHVVLPDPISPTKAIFSPDFILILIFHLIYHLLLLYFAILTVNLSIVLFVQYNMHKTIETL